MIKYDKYDLLELFESEPQTFYEEDVGIYKYSRQDEYGFTFQLYFSAYERTCIVTLLYKDLKYYLFDINFYEVEAITCKEDRLRIYQANNAKNIIILFKPNYSFTFEER